MQSLIAIDNGTFSVSPPEAFLQLTKILVCEAAMIEDVVDIPSKQKAVDCQLRIKTALDEIEKGRKEIKEPYFERCKAIDAKAKELTAPLNQALAEVSALIGDYDQSEFNRVQEERRRLAAEQDRIERERQEEAMRAQLAVKAIADEEAAKAATPAEADAIQKLSLAAMADIAIKQEELARQEKEALGPAPEMARVDGQRIVYDWEIKNVDVHLLAKWHPSLVEIKPRLSEIKDALNRGEQLKGVTAEKKIKSGVTRRQPKTIDV